MRQVGHTLASAHVINYSGSERFSSNTTGDKVTAGEPHTGLGEASGAPGRELLETRASAGCQGAELWRRRAGDSPWSVGEGRPLPPV